MLVWRPQARESQLPLHAQLHDPPPSPPPASWLSPSPAGAVLACWAAWCPLGWAPSLGRRAVPSICAVTLSPKPWVARQSLPAFPSTSLTRVNTARAEPPKRPQRRLPWHSFPLRCIRLVTS